MKRLEADRAYRDKLAAKACPGCRGPLWSSSANYCSACRLNRARDRDLVRAANARARGKKKAAEPKPPRPPRGPCPGCGCELPPDAHFLSKHCNRYCRDAAFYRREAAGLVGVPGAKTPPPPSGYPRASGA